MRENYVQKLEFCRELIESNKSLNFEDLIDWSMSNYELTDDSGTMIETYKMEVLNQWEE